MRKLLVAVGLGTLLAVVGYAVNSARPQKAPPGDGSQPTARANKPPDARTTPTRSARGPDAAGSLALIQRAANAQKHLFLFVYDQDNDATRETRKKFDAAVGKLADAIQWAAVNRADPSESEFIEQLELKTTPLPVVLVLAPNGAVTGGFLSAKVTEQKLLDAVVGPAEQACLKALQDRKLVLLCAQNGHTAGNDAAMKGVDEFKADPRYAEFTEVIKFDPADEAGKKFLANLKLPARLDQATTLFLAPPGSIIAQFTGATAKDNLVAALRKATASCSGAPGCCPTAK